MLCTYLCYPYYHMCSFLFACWLLEDKAEGSIPGPFHGFMGVGCACDDEQVYLTRLPGRLGYQGWIVQLLFLRLRISHYY